MRSLGWEVVEWDLSNPERTFEEFQPDLYLADVRSRHAVPSWIRRGKCQVAMTVDQWADPWAFPALARYGYRTTWLHVRWVRKLDPVVLYHHASPKGIERGWAKWVSRERRTVISLRLAGDPSVFFPVQPDPELSCDVGYLGQYNAYKAPGLDEFLLSYASRFHTAIYGQGWPIGVAIGPDLPSSRRNHFLRSATVVPCIHEPHGRLYGVEVTERLFKVPLAGGFTITDPVNCIHDEGYFTTEEIPVASNGSEMARMVDHFVRNPEERRPFIVRARERVLAEHTYHHRIIELMIALGRLDLVAVAKEYVRTARESSIWLGAQSLDA